MPPYEETAQCRILVLLFQHQKLVIGDFHNKIVFWEALWRCGSPHWASSAGKAKTSLGQGQAGPGQV